MGKGIPDRWHDYQAVGKPIGDTRIVCFKVPLKKTLVARLPWQERFTVDNLLSQLEYDNIDLGLVIDLTYTTRYYQPEQFLSRSIGYQKIYTGGHDIPDESICRQFNDVMDSFLSDDKNKYKFVGVHCTHGLNRTGYLVCRYLIEKKLMRPEDAINAFNAARGHSIERENYLEHLKRLPELLARRPVAPESQVYQINAGNIARVGKQGMRFIRSSDQPNQEYNSPEVQSIKRFKGIRFIRSSDQHQSRPDDDSPEVQSIPSSEQQTKHQESNSSEMQSIPIPIQQPDHQEHISREIQSIQRVKRQRSDQQQNRQDDDSPEIPSSEQQRTHQEDYNSPEIQSIPSSEQQPKCQDDIPPMMHRMHFKHHHANAWQASPFYGRQNSYSGINRTPAPHEQRIWYGDGWTDYNFTPDYMPQRVYRHRNDNERVSRSHKRRNTDSSKGSRRGGSHRASKTTPYQRPHKKGQRTS